MANASMLFFWATLTFLLTACESSSEGRKSTHLWFSGVTVSQIAVEQAILENPLATDQSIRVDNLGQTEAVSHHLLQIRHAEPLHIHRTHDLSVFVYRGNGWMTVGTNRNTVSAGDIVFIPRGAPHRFENTGKEPAVAIVVFSPALTKKDIELVEERGGKEDSGVARQGGGGGEPL